MLSPQPLGIASYLAKHPTKIADQDGPGHRINRQPLEYRRCILGHCPALASDRQPSRPIQQFQVLGNRHRQKPFVATAVASKTCMRMPFSLSGSLRIEFNSNSFGSSAEPSFFFRTGHNIIHRRATSPSSQDSTTSGRDLKIK